MIFKNFSASHCSGGLVLVHVCVQPRLNLIIKIVHSFVLYNSTIMVNLAKAFNIIPEYLKILL